MQAETGTPAAVREFLRRLSGNELKILTAIKFLGDDGAEPTADAIAAEAGISRATTYRALQRLLNDSYIAYSLTDKGLAAVQYALDPIAESNIMVMPGRSDGRLPESQFETSGVNRRSQIETRSQNETGFERGADLNVKPQQVQSNVQPQEWATPLQIRAAELGKLTHRITGDSAHSLGFHIRVMQVALQYDDAQRNHCVQAKLETIAHECHINYTRTGKGQGKAWSARVARLFAELGLTWKRS